MPVIVDPADYARWLDSTTPTDRLLPLLDSRPVAGVVVIAVNPAVNNPRNRRSELLTPAPGVTL
jgi:putative SOS response-associated peptidase YedK